jgi:hypothetical protein
MIRLNLEFFISATEDIEKSEYELLASLKYYSEQFKNYKLYPALSELIEISEALFMIINDNLTLEIVVQQMIQSTAVVKKENDLAYDSSFESNIDLTLDFINWAYPQIQKVIKEGKAVYDFVKQNLKIEVIGKIPIDINEGCFFIVNNVNNDFQIYRYESPLIYSETNFSSLMKIYLTRSISENNLLGEDIYSIKQKLIDIYTDLSNPATFKVEYNLDFPFEETILPIVKRRLVKKLLNR